MLEAAPDAGFVAPETAVVAPGDVRTAPARAGGIPDRSALLAGAATLRPGDAVVHLDHGLGALRGMASVALAGGEGDRARLDCLSLEYAGGVTRLVPPNEMDRLWRYGTDVDAVTPDRLDSDTWPKRRAAVEATLSDTAERVVALARERDGRRAPILRPRRAPFERFAARFPCRAPTRCWSTASTASAWASCTRCAAGSGADGRGGRSNC